MSGFTTYHLRITMEVQTPVRLGPYKGAALRGALVNALRRHYCAAPVLEIGDDAWQAHVGMCPACRLVAAEDATRERGRNVPRAYVIEPPLDHRTRYAPGDRLTFGLGLFADAAALYPYLLTSLSMMGGEGLGHRLDENNGQRGLLSLQRIEAVNPLTRKCVDLMSDGDSHAAAAPCLPVTHDLALREAVRWPTDRLTIRFLTPTRITARGRLVHSAEFPPFFKRLLERVVDLWETYGAGPPDLDAAALIACSTAIEQLADETCWVDLDSRSGRTGRQVPVGGFVGQATYAGHLAPLVPWLLWGQCLHVGKNTVKGNGWFELLP